MRPPAVRLLCASVRNAPSGGPRTAERKGAFTMRTLRRRTLFKYGAAAGGAAMIAPWLSRTPFANAARGGTLTKYLEHVPLPGRGIVVATPRGVQPGLTTYAFTQR